MTDNLEKSTKALMRAIDEYAESRHTNGAAEYNPKTQQARLKVKAIVEKLLEAHATMAFLLPSAPKEVPGLEEFLSK